jgi:hypothetical protein
MSDTVYTDYQAPSVDAAWLNDTNVVIYRVLGSGGTAPTTAGAVLTNIGAAPATGNTAQPFNVAPATSSTQAVSLGQAGGIYATIAGNAAQTFAVAPATSSTQAVALSQIRPTAVSGNLAGAGRVAGATYTNTGPTERRCYLQSGSYNNYSSSMAVSLNGSAPIIFAVDSNSGGGNAATGSFSVPSGWTYVVTAAYGIQSWVEVG